MQHHLKLLGFRVRDVVTGFAGVVTSISFDLYGCVQAIVTPDVGKDGKQPDAAWFDTKRLVMTGKRSVMKLPTFEVVPGGSVKPMPPTQMVR